MNKPVTELPECPKCECGGDSFARNNGREWCPPCLYAEWEANNR